MAYQILVPRAFEIWNLLILDAGYPGFDFLADAWNFNWKVARESSFGP